MNEDLRRKFERQRSAAIGSSSEGERDPGQRNQAMDILRRSFERHAGEVREQQEQVEEARRERAMRYWNEAKTEQEEA